MKQKYLSPALIITDLDCLDVLTASFTKENEGIGDQIDFGDLL